MASLRDGMSQVSKSTHGNSAWAESYGRQHAGLVKEYAARAPRSVQRHLGPSELGSACSRQVVGKMAGTSVAPRTNSIADPWASVMGTAMHAWLEGAYVWDNQRRAEQGMYTRWIPETRVCPDPVRLPDGSFVPGPDSHPGTADLYDAENRAIVDHKGLGPTSLAKLMSKGPKRTYYVQLLLYRRGYQNLGLPVDRVVLLAWPRTKSSLDEMYTWEHVPTDEDEKLVDQVLEETRQRQALAEKVTAGQLDLMEIPATPSDDDCMFCLAGDTEVVTRWGIKPIASLVNTSPRLLVPSVGPNGFRKRAGSFQAHPVRYFGEQPTYKVTLEDRRSGHEITATAEHRWLITGRTHTKRNGEQVVRRQWQKTTVELQPGDLIQPLQRQHSTEPALMDEAVAQGFVFGDGSLPSDPERPATLTIYDNGKDFAMKRFFSRFTTHAKGSNVNALPRFWKELPPVQEPRPFLLSWLAGYFAADGTVSKTGQCSISSADLENLKFVRDLAAVCGIGYRKWKTTSRVGIHATEATDLYELPLQRRDLPSWFFLIDEHRARAEKADAKKERETFWKVVSVEATGRIEPVYCATVEGAEAFGLAWGISTSNCPFYRSQSAYDSKWGCPGTMLGKKES